ncbi:MAG: DinB family protein [Treponema sp.]|jgi:uncharacterized damage-inducible protein DinB|nr:DinB family protein [Treponema sp.]
MTKDVFVVLAEYNREANEKMNGFIGDLNDEEWNREFKGYFPSIRSLCSHLYICDFNWLKRFGGVKEYTVLNDPLFAETLNYDMLLFPGRDEYFAKRPVLDEKLIDLIGETEDAELSKILTYTDSRGTAVEKKFQAPLLQMFNHQTHHRAMISLYLEFLGRPNDFSAILPVMRDM